MKATIPAISLFGLCASLLNVSAHEPLTFTASPLNSMMPSEGLLQEQPEFGLKPGHNVIKVSVKGLAPAEDLVRPALNLSLVIDRSGSMTGGKIEQAKEAAKQLVKRLSPKDLVSIVTYDSSVQVVVPATKASDQAAILAAIDQISIAGNTALFAGVSKGASELRKFLDAQSVNRVLLLSDGQANVGPSSPMQLAELGRSLAKEGITVSTIGLGLGYNEDLMTQLAMTSDGTHSFVEEASNIAKVFDNEFQSLQSIVATDLEASLTCGEGVRPVRVLGQEADIDGQMVSFQWQQLASGQERYFLLEVEVEAGSKGATLDLGQAELRFERLSTETGNSSQALANLGTIRFSPDLEAVVKSQNSEIAINLASQLAVESSRRALALRDKGQLEEAQEVLLGNASQIRKLNERYNDSRLSELEEEQNTYNELLEAKGEEYNRNRKDLTYRNANLSQQKSGYTDNSAKEMVKQGAPKNEKPKVQKKAQPKGR